MSEGNTLKWLVFGLSLIFTHGVYTPIIRHFYLQLKKYETSMVIKKRHPAIVITGIEITFVYIFISRFISNLSVTLIATNTCIIDSCDVISRSYQLIGTLLYSSTILASPIYIAYKYWMIYYGIYVYIFTYFYTYKLYIDLSCLVI